MKIIFSFLISFSLLASSSKSAINLANDSAGNAIVNLPRAINTSSKMPVCERQLPEDKAACQAKKQKQTEEMTKAMKKKR